MISEPIVASRCFSEEFQQQFAKLSGDWNPMHVDAVSARRTQPGAPVVHGMHALLWALDSMALDIPSFRLIQKIRTNFFRWIYVGSCARLVIVSSSSTEIKAHILVESVVAVNIVIELGSLELPRGASHLSRFASPLEPELARELEFREMASQAGTIDAQSPLLEVEAFFPHLSAVLQPERVSALIALSRLVGMICPGLYSIISAVTIEFKANAQLDGSIAYRVNSTIERYRIVKLEIDGSGISGVVQTFVRVPPAQQIPIDIVAERVRSDEFLGAHALVVGGSRGLGELTAKIIAAGGGDVTITYAAGEADALGVAHQIHQFGGSCRVMFYDALQPSEPQLRGLASSVTHAYYFATGQIFRPKKGIFSHSVYTQFNRFYVDGFFDFCQSLAARSPSDNISVFYPSSIAVADRPVDTTEYAMAKAAGEILCEDISRYMAGINVIMSRLPRLPTDQTLTVIPVRASDPLEILLPLIREVQRAGVKA